jgi:long-chain fatty acid transport protein
MRRRRSWRTIWALLLLLAWTAPGNVRALTDEEVFREFRFNFVNPGARALGLGGAYIAAADDATAAVANPAALHYVNRMEVFAEYRSISTDDFESSASKGNNDIFSPEFNLPYLELNTKTVQDDANFPSFVSFAFPFKLGKVRTTLALSRQVVLKLSNGIDGSDLDFAFVELPWVNPDGGDPNNPSPTVEQYTVANSSLGGLDAEIVNYNVGISFSVGSDLSLGATATLSNLDMQSALVNRVQDPLGVLNTENPRVDRDNDGLADDFFTTSMANGTDSGFAYSLGLHYHPDSKFEAGFSPIRFGLVYNKGAEMAVPQTVVVDPGGGQTVTTFENTVRVPDRFGIGVSGEVGRSWLFSLDLERINYSDLLENYRSGENFFTGGLIDDTVLNIGSDDVVFDVDDATVVHLGVEYNLITRGRWTYGFRVGFFNAPDNRIRMTQFNSTDDTTNEVFLDAFSGGEDQNHYTAGFSFNTPISLQFQFAGDFAENSTQFLASAIYRFGKVRR